MTDLISKHHALTAMSEGSIVRGEEIDPDAEPKSEVAPHQRMQFRMTLDKRFWFKAPGLGSRWKEPAALYFFNQFKTFSIVGLRKEAA
mgnify:CR=1 FL=1